MTRRICLHGTASIRRLRAKIFGRLVAGSLTGPVLEIRAGVETLADDCGIVGSLLVPQDEVAAGDSRLAGRHFESIVWFNGMNLCRPRHGDVLATLSDALSDGGHMFLSFAAHSFFPSGSASVERTTAAAIVAPQGDSLGIDFQQTRFSTEEMRELTCKDFAVARFEMFDAEVELDETAFREWHRGSVGILFSKQVQSRERTVHEFLTRLYTQYLEGHYRPRVTTALMVLRRH